MAKKLDFNQFEYKERQVVNLELACEILNLGEYRVLQLAREGKINSFMFAKRRWFDLESLEQRTISGKIEQLINRAGESIPKNIRGL